MHSPPSSSHPLEIARPASRRSLRVTLAAAAGALGVASVLLYAAGLWELAAITALVSLGASLARGRLVGTATWILAVGSGILILAVLWARDRPCTSDSFNGLTCTTSAGPDIWHTVLVGASAVALGLAGLGSARLRRAHRR